MSDDAFFGDCRLPFRSVHGTLSHLAMSDALWTERLDMHLNRTSWSNSENEGPAYEKYAELMADQDSQAFEAAIGDRSAVLRAVVYNAQDFTKLIDGIDDETLENDSVSYVSKPDQLSTCHRASHARVQ
jgi:uncharacterized damage-inducible protein DinB